MRNRPERITENLRCILTDTEKAALSEELVRTFEEMADADKELSRAKLAHKTIAERLGSRQAFLVATLSKGYEYRDVVCAVVYNSPRPGLKTMLRVDAPGEIVREGESMTDDERQENLPLEVQPVCAGCAYESLYHPAENGMHKSRDGEAAALTCKAPPMQKPADGFRLEPPSVEDVPPVVQTVPVVQTFPEAQAQAHAND